MDISFAERDLQVLCNRLAHLRARWGEHDGRWIGRRLSEMRAAPTLADLVQMPGGCQPSADGHDIWTITVGNVVTVRFQPDPPCTDVSTAATVKAVTVTAIVDHVAGEEAL